MTARIVMAGACALSLACSGAGEDATIDEVDANSQPRSAQASPFVVDMVPAGFALETAGRGTDIQEWGEDSTGTDEPFTVLAPPGVDAGEDGVVIVSVTGYAGYQGGLSQASGGYGSEDAEEFEVGGEPAIHTPAGADGFGPDTEWADLVVSRGDDLAVRVTTADADRDELVDIARRVEPADDRARAPSVPDPPDGLEDLGSVDAGVEISLSAHVWPDSDSVPGLGDAYGAGWLSGRAATAPETGGGSSPTVFGAGPPTVGAGPGGASAAPGGPDGPATAADGREPVTASSPEPTSLTLVAYPGRVADLGALAALTHLGHSARTVTPLTVGGRPGVLVESRPGDESSPRWLSRTVLTHAPWGDLLMAGGSGVPEGVPTADQLAEMLASVRQTTAGEWDAFEVEAAGGPGLHPDDGAIELERGTVTGADGEVDWLLQARSGVLDGCIKLSSRERACATGGSSSEGTSFGTGGGIPDQDGGVPEFVLATIGVPGARLRVTTPEGTVEGTLHPIPDSHLWGGVVFADGLGTAAPLCGAIPEPPEDMTAVTVEVLDEVGAVVGCVDIVGGVRSP
jgi:hypothetical protein